MANFFNDSVKDTSIDASLMADSSNFVPANGIIKIDDGPYLQQPIINNNEYIRTPYVYEDGRYTPVGGPIGNVHGGTVSDAGPDKIPSNFTPAPDVAISSGDASASWSTGAPSNFVHDPSVITIDDGPNLRQSIPYVPISDDKKLIVDDRQYATAGPVSATVGIGSTEAMKKALEDYINVVTKNLNIAASTKEIQAAIRGTNAEVEVSKYLQQINNECVQFIEELKVYQDKLSDTASTYKTNDKFSI